MCIIYIRIFTMKLPTYVVALIDRHLHTAFGAVHSEVQCYDQTNSIHYLVHCIYP